MSTQSASRERSRSATRRPELPAPVAHPPGASFSGAMPAQSFVGVVVSAAAGEWTLRSGLCEVRARRAAGCLLEPAPGDTVAWTGVGSGEAWVTAVLQREPGTLNVLRCEGATRLEVAGGGLCIESPDLALESGMLALRTRQLSVVSDSAEIVGREWSFFGTTIKVAGALLSTVFDRVIHFSKSHIRTTEGVDRIQAAHLECEARQVLKISGQHTLVNGEKLVKARGAQIHFG